MGEFLTVKEFAKRAGVSTQAVYARLQSKDFASFVQVAQGKKTIDSAALPLFSCKQEKQLDCKENNNLQLEIMEKVLDSLREQLTVKDKQLAEQLAEKDKQLAEKDKQLQAAAEEKAQLLERLKDAQQAEQQAHALHAGTMKTALIECRPADPEQTAEKRSGGRGWKFWRR